MRAQKQRRPAVAGPGVEDREHFGQGARRQFITAAEIAHALEARRTSPGKWIAQCVGHADRTPSMSIAEGDRGPLLYCFAGCSQDELIEALRERGLWHTPTARGLKARRRRDEAKDKWRETVRLLVKGAPLPAPPFTKSLPRHGEVWVVIGAHAWETAKSLRAYGRHSLVWPPEVPCNGFRWPVTGRTVLVLDTTDDLAPSEMWADAARDFARLLIARWGAATVRLFGDFEPVSYQPEGVRHAA